MVGGRATMAEHAALEISLMNLNLRGQSVRHRRIRRVETRAGRSEQAGHVPGTSRPTVNDQQFLGRVRLLPPAASGTWDRWDVTLHPPLPWRRAPSRRGRSQMARDMAVRRAIRGRYDAQGRSADHLHRTCRQVVCHRCHRT